MGNTNIEDGILWDDKEYQASRNPHDVLWDVYQPKIYIGESSIDGWGTMARVPLKKGEGIFIVFTPHIMVTYRGTTKVKDGSLLLSS